MSRPDFHAIYADPVEAELCSGFYDGYRKESPEPGPNRHPAYIHGFRNGRDDIGMSPEPRRTVGQIRAAWAYIAATCAQEGKP